MVRDIPVSEDNYVLALSTLSERFYRQQLAATSLTDKFLHASTMTQDSLQYLNIFVSVFNEVISLLEALKIPDMGSPSFYFLSRLDFCLSLPTSDLKRIVRRRIRP